MLRNQSEVRLRLLGRLVLTLHAFSPWLVGRQFDALLLLALERASPNLSVSLFKLLLLSPVALITGLTFCKLVVILDSPPDA